MADDLISPAARSERAGRPLLFYSYWPLGYHSPEAERKALALSETGYEVVYVTGVGIRNPTLSTARKAAERLFQKIRQRSAVRESRQDGLSTASVLVMPPRQFRSIQRFNARWLRRQLRHSFGRWSETVAWIRFPTPELVEAIAEMRPYAVIYECVDAYDELPLTRGAFRTLVTQAERDLVSQSDVVVVPTEALAERFRSAGKDIRVIPHGVELELFPWPPAREQQPGPTTVGFIGTLDFRLDLSALRYVAERHPDWRIRLIGEIGDLFDPGSLSDVANISVEPAVPHERIGELIAGFSAGIMPYVDWPGYRYTVPVKNFELMAAGKPAVARPSPALMPYADLVYFAEKPEEYCAQLERALEEDSADLRRLRRQTAEANTWQRRLAEIQQVAREIAPPA